MATFDFRPNLKGYDELMQSKGVQRELRRRGEAVAAAARASAAVDTGAYRDSIRVEADEHPTRAAVHVIGGTDHGLAVEFATRNLASSLDAARD